MVCITCARASSCAARRWICLFANSSRTPRCCRSVVLSSTLCSRKIFKSVSSRLAFACARSLDSALASAVLNRPTSRSRITALRNNNSMPTSMSSHPVLDFNGLLLMPSKSRMPSVAMAAMASGVVITSARFPCRRVAMMMMTG